MNSINAHIYRVFPLSNATCDNLPSRIYPGVLSCIGVKNYNGAWYKKRGTYGLIIVYANDNDVDKNYVGKLDEYVFCYQCREECSEILCSCDGVNSFRIDASGNDTDNFGFGFGDRCIENRSLRDSNGSEEE